MIITCNKQIVDIRYSGHTISKVYACGGELVYDKDSGSTDSYMVMVRSETSSGDLTAYEPCNSSSAATNQIWVAEGSGTIINKEDVNVMWIGECAIEIGEGAFQNYTHLRLIPNSGANTRDTMVISLIRMLMDGPEVSLNGSPTVSPTTVAL